MGKKKTIAWNGEVFSSMSEAAKANGVVVSTMTKRIGKGYTCDDDMLGSGSNMSICICWNGEDYPSIAAAAKAHKITREAMRQRIKKGYTCDDDLA